MRVLLDTCVLSEIRREQGSQAVKAEVRSLPAEAVFISVVTVGELAKGIGLLPPGKKRQALERWYSELLVRFASHILPVDLETSQIWGEVTARAGLQGIVVPAADGLLAATALRHGLHLITRNTRHVAATGVLLRDPWSDANV